MKDIDKFVAGIVAIGLVTAVGLNAAGLTKFVGAVGGAGKQIENTAITGNR